MPDFPDLYVLRHGQTEWNAAGRMQGQMDSPLTALGRAQAEAQGRILSRLDLPPDTTFHVSPLGRARETARIALAGLCAAPQVDARLAEVSVGAFEGLTLADVEHDWPQILSADDPVSWHFRAPGGERFEPFRDRIAAWLGDQHAPAVVVTHGMVSGVLRGLALGLGLEGIRRLPGGQGIVYRVSARRHSRLEP